MDDKPVSEAELQAAIRKFVEQGGIITKLPEQKATDGRMVGGKWNNSEVASERS